MQHQSLGPQVHRVHQAPQGYKASRALPAHQVIQVPKVLPDNLVLPEVLDYPGPQEEEVYGVLQGPRVPRERGRKWFSRKLRTARRVRTRDRRLKDFVSH